MTILERIKAARQAFAGSWNWSGGTKSGLLFDGSKFSGASIYPSFYGEDTQELRDKSRTAYFESTQARSIICRLSDNVIGTGLTPECSPVWDILKITDNDDDRHRITKDIEQRFMLWAESKEADATGRSNFYGLQKVGFDETLKDGETFVILRYSKDPSRMNPLSIQFINPDQVQTPHDAATAAAAKKLGREIHDGIEIDEFGKEYAIHVKGADGKFTRIPFYGDGGRRFVLHPFIADTIGKIRGVPFLSSIVHELRKITDGTVAELEAMVINALMAVWVKPSQNRDASNVFKGIAAQGKHAAQSSSEAEGSTETVTFDKPGLIIQSLKAGEEVQSFDSKRPNINFNEFVRQITKSISASKSVPIEVLEESFSANYSASRASLLLFWKSVEIWRGQMAAQFLNDVYEAWFSEEVKAGRINARGFSNSPLFKRAWLNCTWNGDKLPSIDPLKEANAVRVRIEDGATTRERAAMEHNGSDFSENVERLKKENLKLSEANAPMKDGQSQIVDLSGDGE